MELECQRVQNREEETKWGISTAVGSQRPHTQVQMPIGLLNSFPRTFSLVGTSLYHMGGTPGEMAIRSFGFKI